MAAGTLALSNLVLRDNWPGLSDMKREPPQDGFGAKNTKDNNVATATLPLGTKCTVFDPIAGGEVTFIYLVMDAVLGATIGKLCGAAAAAWTATIDPVNVNTTGVLAGLAAVATGTVAVSKNAWFWCGGPCPLSDFLVGGTALSVVTVITDTVTIGMALEIADEAGAGVSLEIQALATAGAQCIGFSKANQT